MYGEYPTVNIIDANSLNTMYLRITPDFYNCEFTTAYTFEISANYELYGYS